MTKLTRTKSFRIILSSTLQSDFEVSLENQPRELLFTQQRKVFGKHGLFVHKQGGYERQSNYPPRGKEGGRAHCRAQEPT